MATTLNAGVTGEPAGVHTPGVGIADRSDGRPFVAALAAGGVFGPLIFTVLVLAQGLLQPDYSHVALPISALAAWPLGWIQNLNFIVFGSLMIAYAIGLHLGVRHGGSGAIGTGLLVLSGLGLLTAGAFPWRAATSGFVIPPGHVVASFLCFLGTGSGLIVLSRRMAADPRWRGVASYALATGAAMIVLFIAYAILARVPDAPLYPWGGVVQRVMVAVWFVCTLVLGFRLLRLERKGIVLMKGATR